MSKIKFELNQQGVRELLRSDEMMQVIEGYADGVRSRCGPGYDKSSYRGKNRVNVSVRASSRKAKRDNLKNNTLLKSLGGGSG